MSQSIFVDANLLSPPALQLGAVGNGTLTVNKLTHFTVSQEYTAVCTGTDPFTVFNIVGSLDGVVGVAIVGQQFVDEDIKIFLTINQGPVLFAVGDTFKFTVEQGTDLTQANLDTYDELPQKNFGAGIIGENKGNDNIRFSGANELASKEIQDLLFTSKLIGTDGNEISIQYLAGSYLTAASKIIQDLRLTASVAGSLGNNIRVAYEQFDAAIAANKIIQNIGYEARNPGILGNLISVQYIAGGVAGSELVTVVGNAITVQIANGVSTADQIRIAIGSNINAYNLIDGYSTGSGLEPQFVQPQTFLEGGLNAVGDAGNEVITVSGDLVTVKLESGVSTAQNIYDAFYDDPIALAKITPTITGVASNTQIAPYSAVFLEGGLDANGIPGSEVVSVVNKEIKITFVNGASTANQIKTAVQNNVSANALVTVSLLGTGSELESSPVSKTFLSGGTSAGTFSFNTKEITAPGTFKEGNASLLFSEYFNQGSETTLGKTTKKEKVTLDDTNVVNNSGPKVDNAQLTINNLIRNGKAFLLIDNEEKCEWTLGYQLLCDEDILLVFSETNVVNRILASSFPLSINDGQHVYFTVNRLVSSNVSLTVSSTVPEGENIFRLVSRKGTTLVWWDNTLQRKGKKLRIGEGAGLASWQEKIGVANGVQKNYPILSGFFPVSESSILVFSNTVNFLSDDWNYDLLSNEIRFVNAPTIGTEIYIFFLTEGESLNPPTPTGVLHSYVHTVSLTEEINKEIELTGTPSQPSKILVDIIGGSAQVYGEDFVISVNRFIWNGYNLDGFLSYGDKVRFRFYT